MKKFEIYEYTYFYEKWEAENKSVFGNRNNGYQEGYGFGFFGSSVYCRPDGSGEGNGYDSGTGSGAYPFMLIQYWL